MSIARGAGILLPVSSLPSPYGIGSFGKSAYDFVDFLETAGQKYWQVLPLGPTSYGDSPYQSFSTFAGNPYFVDLDMLAEEGLLSTKEIKKKNWGKNPRYVDYFAIYQSRFEILALAAERAYQDETIASEIAAFAEQEREWLPDYALFMACKRHFEMRAWTEWEDEALKMHEESACAYYREKLYADIRLFVFIQFEFFKQWDKLRAYAHAKDIKLIGDMPIYVAMDSADVWANPEFFQLDEMNLPVEVAGVPPDYFSEDGQLWGNPLYDYKRMREDGYGWWIRRVGGTARLFDIIRIDHFRGFEQYWAVPYGAKTAKQGRWVEGPNMDLIGRLQGWFKDVELIAEDLGILTPGVYEMIEASGLPGMKVLLFAFSNGEPSEYQPHRFTKNCVCYAGTHDNATILEWAKEADPADVAFAREYFNMPPKEELNWGILRGGMASVANLFVAQMQDYLGLSAEGRTNTPGTLGMNWQWRLLPGEASEKLAQRIAKLSATYER